MLRWKVILLYTCAQICVLCSETEKTTSETDTESENEQPHIIIILADDLCWNDVSYHGSNLFQTPNIDALAYNGIILHEFHTPSLCTPSRSALMTGKFPIHLGMQHSVILEAEPWGLPLNINIFPQYLNSVGYTSHYVGKWHLGFHKKEFTPTYRGFVSHFGSWQGHQDYYTHMCHETGGSFKGYDFRGNLTRIDDVKGLYTTDLLTAETEYLISKHDKQNPLFLVLSHIAPHAGEKSNPLQAPSEEIEKFSYIKNAEKQKYAAMVSKLDESVGKVVKALHKNDMLRNSVIMFVSDNGAPTIGIHANTGSCHPLRGMKETEFEGGTRTPAIIWSPLLTNQQRVSNILMHMVDVLPTLSSPAGVPSTDLEHIDGINMWDALKDGSNEHIRSQFPYNIDPAEEKHAVGAVRVGNYKYYQGDATSKKERFDWLGNKYANSDLVDIMYSTEAILDSEVNKAISDLYNRMTEETNLFSKSLQHQPLTQSTILTLRSATEIKCPENEPFPECDPTKTCVLNLKRDPCERFDYTTEDPLKTNLLKTIFEYYRRQVVPPLNQPRDNCANPDYWNGHWVNWYDFETIMQNLSVGGKCKPSCVLFLCVGILTLISMLT